MFYATLGNEAIWVAILSNVVWLAILVFATYGIGKRLWSARVGWLSVVFVVTAPMIVSSSKDYMLDMPLTAIAALSLFVLLRTEGFSRRGYSLLFGAVCGCGLLVKWTFPLILLLPAVHVSAQVLGEARQRRRFAPLLNLASAAALTLVVAGPWYAHNFTKVLGSLNAYGAKGVTGGNPRVASTASSFWYLWNLLNDQLYLLPFLFLLVGVVFCFRKHELARRNLLPILMALGTYVTFTMLRHKDPRYTLAMLPALAIVATSWLEYVSARTRAWATTLFVAYSAAAFLAISFGTSLLPKSLELSVPSASFTPSKLSVFSQEGDINGAPSHEHWHQADPFKAIAQLPRAERSFAYQGPDTIWFNAHGLNYYALRYGATWSRTPETRFLIQRGANAGSRPGYTRLQRWQLPDGGMLALYERTA